MLLTDLEDTIHINTPGLKDAKCNSFTSTSIVGPWVLYIRPNSETDSGTVLEYSTKMNCR